MFARFLNGLVFGAGFGTGVIIVAAIANFVLMPTLLQSTVRSSASTHALPPAVVTSVPVIPAERKYLGSSAITSGDFSREGVLASGPGQIIGSALGDGQPVQGLKIRLALNGSVMSQWAETDARGKYGVKVPYGEYKIEGFELDYISANTVLPGKILRPRGPYSSDVFVVNREAAGRGLDLQFVEPIIKKITSNVFAPGDDIVLEWEDYPGAVQYSVQLYEKTEAHDWNSTHVFEWHERPQLLEAGIRLNDYDIDLRTGKYYRIDITAHGEGMRVLSESVAQHGGYDFVITDE